MKASVLNEFLLYIVWEIAPKILNNVLNLVINDLCRIIDQMSKFKLEFFFESMSNVLAINHRIRIRCSLLTLSTKKVTITELFVVLGPILFLSRPLVGIVTIRPSIYTQFYNITNTTHSQRQTYLIHFKFLVCCITPDPKISNVVSATGVAPLTYVMN